MSKVSLKSVNNNSGCIRIRAERHDRRMVVKQIKLYEHQRVCPAGSDMSSEPVKLSAGRVQHESRVVLEQVKRVDKAKLGWTELSLNLMWSRADPLKLKIQLFNIVLVLARLVLKRQKLKRTISVRI